MAPRLEITGPEFTSRAVSFMNLMRVPAFRNAFEKDPAGVSMREFHLHLPSQAISSSNETLASLLKNPSFNKWANEFQSEIEKRYPALQSAKTVGEIATMASKNSQSIFQEFAKGVAAHLPRDLADKFEQVGAASKGQIAAEDDIAIVLLVFIAVVVVVVAPTMRDDLLSRNTVRLLVNQLEILKTAKY